MPLPGYCCTDIVIFVHADPMVRIICADSPDRLANYTMRRSSHQLNLFQLKTSRTPRLIRESTPDS